MKTCEEYILKKFLESEAVIAQKDEEITELNARIWELENPNADSDSETKTIDCITLQKSSNVIYQLKTNTSLYDYKEKFKSSIANGKTTIEEMKKALEDDKALEELNERVVISRWAFDEKMYQFEPFTRDLFELNLGGIQYLIRGNYDNLSLDRLNDLDRENGFFYECNKEVILQKVKEKVRSTLQNTIKAIEEEQQNEQSGVN